MQLKNKLLILLFVISNLTVFAQAKIEFQKEEFDFHNVTEGTLATHDFIFKNTGTEPLLINNVRASCGCTTPFWTKDPILPGKEGKISASYDSKNRPGAFHKSISVITNADEPTKTLYIKGVVIPEDQVEKVFSDKDIALSPKLKIDKKEYQLGKIEKGQNVTVNLEISNPGKSTLKILQLKSDCNCIRVDPYSSKSVVSGKSETLKIIYSPQLIGNKEEVVIVQTNDITSPESTFTIQAEVVQNLSNKSIIKEASPSFTF